MCKFCPTPDLAPYLPYARKGAEFLDTNGPKDWRDMIATGRLNLGSSEDCVLGQLYEDFHTGTDKLGICDEFATANGFVLDDNIQDGDYDEDARERALAAAWAQVINEGRAALNVAVAA